MLKKEFKYGFKFKDYLDMSESQLEELFAAELDFNGYCTKVVHNRYGFIEARRTQKNVVGFKIGLRHQDQCSISIDSTGLTLKGDRYSPQALYALHKIYHRQTPFYTAPSVQNLNWWEADVAEEAYIIPDDMKASIEQCHNMLHNLVSGKSVTIKALAIGMDLKKGHGLKGAVDLPEPTIVPRQPGRFMNEFLRDETPLDLHIIFGDQQRIDVLEREHPFLVSIDPKWLIDMKFRNLNDNPYQQWLNSWRANYFPTRNGIRLAHFLSTALESEEVELFLYDRKNPELGWPIAHVFPANPNNCGWQIETLPDQKLLFKPNPSSGQLKNIGYNIAHDSKTKALHFHLMHSSSEQIAAMAKASHGKQANQWIFESRAAAELVAQKLESHFGVPIKRPPERELSQADHHLQINLDRNKPGHIGIKLVLHERWAIHHVHPACVPYLDAVNYGISEFVGEEGRDLAINRRGSLRQRELTMFRHRGFALSLVLQIFDALTKDQQLSPEKIKEIKRNNQNLSREILKIPPHQKDFNSKRVNQVVDHMLEQAQSPLKASFILDGHDYRFNPLLVYAPLLCPVLSCLLEKHGDKTFLKTKLPDEVYPTYEDEENGFELGSLHDEHPTTFSSGKVYPNIIAHLPEKTELVVDEAAVETFEIEDFRSELSINDASKKIDWFELDPRFYFKGEEVTIHEARQITEGGIVEFQGRLYRIDPKSMPAMEHLDRLWHRLQNLQGGHKGKRKSKVYPVPRSASLELLALRKAGLEAKGGERWKALCREFDLLETRRAQVPELSHCEAPLKAYQRQGVQWMLDLHKLQLGGILADDMGLGKTLQALCFLQQLQREDKSACQLIVVPSSLVYNWISERDKFTPELRLRCFDPKAKHELKEQLETEPCAMLCSYGLFQRHSETIKDKHWQTVLFDEAQNLKNISSKRCTEARSLGAISKFALSGTPLENHFGEVFSLIDLVVPGALGSYAEFMKTYSPKQGKSERPVSAGDIEFLKLKTAPLVLRRTKALVLKELPAKTENVILVPFEKKQEAIYKDVAISWNKKVRNQIDAKGDSQSQLQMLTALLRLRQVCSHPDSLPNISYSKTPPKVELLIEQVEALIEKGESVLIFTNFLKTLEHIEARFSKDNIAALSLHGGKTMDQRKKILKSFDDSEDPMVLLMTLKTGGVGLNLTKANHVFHLEPWWNPAAENQGTDRVHRMGQTQHVHVTRFIMQNSIEEKIQSLKLSKSQRFDALFSESVEELDAVKPSALKSNALSQKDFEWLLDFQSTPSNRRLKRS
jgi:SNF2 family DNA or RNA helicase